MDAFELLKMDHEKVSQLFKEIESASGQAKRKLFTQLKGELDVHARIEEKVLYPALENTKEAREITLESYEEHKVVKNLLAELANGAVPDDEWDAKLTVLRENVEHHVEEEEGELFSKARKALSSEELDRIGVELEAEKARQQGATEKPAKRRPTKASKAQSGTKSRQPSGQSESPGVLKRIANFIGLGDGSTASAKGTKKAGKASASSKTSASGRPSVSKKASKGKPGKSGPQTARKTAAKKSATKAKSAAKKTPASKSKTVTTASTSRANKRAPSSGKRGGSRKAAPRSGSSRKGSGPASSRRSKAR